LILSITVTVAVSELEFPLLSVTVSVTVFVPISPQTKVVMSKLLISSAVGVTSSVEPLSISSAVILASPFASNTPEPTDLYLFSNAPLQSQWRHQKPSPSPSLWFSEKSAFYKNCNCA
jgi:hypothetical protein